MNKFYNFYWEKKIEAKKQGDDFNECRHLRIKLDRVSQYIPKNKNITIVDYGCGDGKIITEMSKINPEARYIGLDVSEIGIREASVANPQSEFYKIIDGEKVPLDELSVDFVICSEVIEHIYDVKSALSEIYRILKVNGRFLITTPYHGFIKNLLIICKCFDQHFNPTGPHIRFFSRKTLFSCITEVGFRRLKHGYFGRIYPVPHCMFVLAEKTDNYLEKP